MVEIDGKIYEKQKVLKALKLYEALTSGKLVEQIKNRCAENEF